MALSTHVPVLAALEMLLSVARTGSLNSAARNAGVTQQAVSARIRAMEAQTGVTLVHHTPRGSSLTTEGVVIAEWAGPGTRCRGGTGRWNRCVAARPAQQAADQRQLDHCRAAPAGVAGDLPRGRPGRRACPDIVLTAANTETVIRHVTEGTADIGFTEGPQQQASPRSRVIGHDRLVVIAAPGHPWARRRSGISAAELCSTPLVSREAAPAPGTPWPRRWPLRSVPALSRSPRRCRCLPLQRSGRRCWPARRQRSSASSPSPTT